MLTTCRVGLLESSTSAVQARETDRTAGLENRELLQMQQRVMDDQDAELAELEKTVNSTKVGGCPCRHAAAAKMACILQPSNNMQLSMMQWWHSFMIGHSVLFSMG